jgi:hypothetical protein
MKRIIAGVKHRLFDFESKSHAATQGTSGIQRLNGSQLHQLVKASRSEKKNRPAQIYKGIDIDGNNVQPRQLYKRAKANGYDVKRDVVKSDAGVQLKPTSMSAQEKDTRQKNAANAVRIVTAPTVIFAPIAAALQRWYFDPRDENKLEPFRVTAAVKAKIAQTMLKRFRAAEEQHQERLVEVAEKYGVTPDEVKQWTWDYMNEIAQKVQGGLTPEAVAAAYGEDVESVNVIVQRHKDQSAFQAGVARQVIEQQRPIKDEAERSKAATSDAAQQQEIVDNAYKECRDVIVRAAEKNGVSTVDVLNWVRTYNQELAKQKVAGVTSTPANMHVGTRGR